MLAILPILVCLLAGSVVTPSSAQYVRGGFTVNNGQYTLKWEIFGGFATFRAIARGTGFVGFGLSPQGTMEGSDLFVSGMYDNGTVFAIDAHGAAEKDATSNYMLIFVRQTDMYTEVHFRRALFTRDCKEDIRIMNKPQYIIWSIGPPGDALEHHGKENRGAVLQNLLNPPVFHAYYFTDPNIPMDNNMGCMDGGSGSSGGGGDAKEEAKPVEPEEAKPAEAEEATPAEAEEAVGEKQEVEPDATQI